MAKYGQFKYGKIEQYGKYSLSSGGNLPKGQVRYRIRSHDYDGKTSDFVTISEERMSISKPYQPRIRIRANDGDWVTTDHRVAPGDPPSVRIRTIDSQGNLSPWVIGTQGNLK